jgi:hypothetical protein
MIKNKQGFLLGEETIKIIIAVICIGFLVYLLAAVYFSFNNQESAKQAQASLKDVIVNEITRINNGGAYNTQGILIPNPPSWYIFSFTGNDKKPNSCTGSNCICICENILINIFDRQISQCDSTGSCSIVPNLNSFNKIEIGNSGTYISIQKVNNAIEIKPK